MNFLDTFSLYGKEVDGVVINTDLEPDDVWAIAVLARRLPPSTRVMFVVGESEKSKTVMLREMLATLPGFRDRTVTVVQGQKSKNPFPDEAERAFSDNPLRAADVAKESSTVTQSVETFLMIHKNPGIVMLKPSVEIVNQDPKQLRKCVIAIYGSFNFREGIKSGRIDKSALENFLRTPTRGTYLFENSLSLPPGSGKSLGPSVQPEFFRKLERLANEAEKAGPTASPEKKFARGLLKMMKAWNSTTFVKKTKKVKKYWINYSVPPDITNYASWKTNADKALPFWTRTTKISIQDAKTNISIRFSNLPGGDSIIKEISSLSEVDFKLFIESQRKAWDIIHDIAIDRGIQVVIADIAVAVTSGPSASSIYTTMPITASISSDNKTIVVPVQDENQHLFLVRVQNSDLLFQSAADELEKVIDKRK